MTANTAISDTQNLTIIGAGLACFNLVKFLRKRKFKGNIVVISGCQGSQYYKPKLSTGFSDAMTPEDHVLEQPEQWAEKYDVQLVNNTWVEKIVSADNLLLTSSGEYRYDQLVLAYGAQPRKLTDSTEFKDVLHDVNSLESYEAFFYRTQDKSIKPAIVGAGLVGCELASDLANSGYSPTIISSGSYPFHNLFPQAFSEYLQDKLIDAGVTFINKEKVVNFAHADEGLKLELSSGAQLQSPLAINCAGLTVNTDLAKAAGIKTDAGIITNDLLQTNIDNIYAIGDCAQIGGQLHQYIAPILICTRALASTLLGKPKAVNLSFYPIEVKIQQSPTRFMIKQQPDEWSSILTTNGMVSRGFKDGELSAFAVTGDAIGRMNDLVVEMMA